MSFSTLQQNMTPTLDVAVPDRLSRWVKMALGDAKRAMQRPEVAPNMAGWVIAGAKGVYGAPCTVCLAGAVMLEGMSEADRQRVFNYPAVTEMRPEYYGKLAGPLRALNHVRAGRYYEALGQFYGYSKNPVAQCSHLFRPGQPLSDANELWDYGSEFVKTMRERAKLLAQHGF